MKKVLSKYFSVCFSITLLSGATVTRAQDSVIDNPSDETITSAESDNDVTPFFDRDHDDDHGRDHDHRPGHPGGGYPGGGYPGGGYPGGGYPGGGYPGGGQPYPPQPNPYFCQQFNYNQWQCQNNGCFYDIRNNGCYAQGGGYPQPVPPNNGRGFYCTAVDAGWEEHGGAHRGFGYGQYQAQQAAMGDCLRFHGRCRVTQCQMQ